MKKIIISFLLLFVSVTMSFGYTSDDFVWDFEWLEENNTVEIVVDEDYQLHYSCTTNYSKVFTAEMASNWIHYDFSNGQHIVDPPTGYSISESGVITGLIPGSYAMKFTGLIQAKAGADKWLYINVVSERREKESNNTLDTANDIYTKIRFGLSNSSDVDYFRFKHNLSYGDYVTFKVHYEGYNDEPFGYKWSTFMGDMSLSGAGSLMSQDQECNALVTNGEYVYFEVYYDQSRAQYFNYGEEFVVQVYVNGEPVTNQTINVSGISIDPSYLTLKIGESYNLSATVTPNNASDKSISWSTANSSVATVNSSGNVVAKGLGTTTITATANDGSGVQATCEVTVEATSVEQITLSQTTATLKVGESFTLSADVYPSNATDKTVSWSTTNSSVATVNSSGKVVAKGLGTTTITATANDGSGVQATCEVTVEATSVEQITLSQTTATLKVGESFTLSADVYPSNATDKTVSWSTANSSVATVNSSGKVVAKGLGTTTITATANDGSGVQASCEVTVEATSVEQITLSQTTATLKVGESFTLSADVYPSNATDKTVSWSTANSSVATVNSSGKVVAKGLGTTTITATANDGSGVQASCEVTVEATSVEQITLSQTTATLKVGESFTLSADVYPSNATDKTVSWSTTNSSVATVNSSGKVVAKGLGTTTITATANDGSGVQASCEVTVEAQLVTKIELSQTNVTLAVGETCELIATIYPDDATDTSVSWSSENEDVAFVGNNGKVVAIAPGTTKIIVTANDGSGVSASAFITVSDILVTDITLNYYNYSLDLNETLQLEATVEPENATNKQLIWTSSDESVVLVSSSGKVLWMGTGFAEVSATATDGSNVSATCSFSCINGIATITVDAPSSVRIFTIEGKEESTMQKGVNIIVYPDGHTEKIIRK